VAKLINWRNDNEREAFFEQVELHGHGLRAAQASAKAHGDDLHPREARDALVRVEQTVRELDRVMRRMDALQSKAGTVRQLMGDFHSWDELDDARHVILDFAGRAKAAIGRYRKAMGTSPQQPDPVRGWAEQILILFRKYDRDPALGRRGQADDEGGRFQRLLEILAAPLGIEVRWPTIERYLRKIEEMSAQSK
jgi:hypothetical protein